MEKQREGLLKNAFFPIWTRVPGTPFSLPGNMDPSERLPGMDTWAPRERMERVSAGMHAGVPVDAMMQAEGDRDLVRHTLTGIGAGALGGGMLGRLVGGQESTQPFKDVIQKGLSKETLKELAHLPTSMKALVAAGGIGGALYGADHWSDTKPDRMHQTYETARSLGNDQMLNDVNIMKAKDYLASSAKKNKSLLDYHPNKQQTSAATEAIPHIVSSGRE
jgi:hypothetical protein